MNSLYILATLLSVRRLLNNSAIYKGFWQKLSSQIEQPNHLQLHCLVGQVAQLLPEVETKAQEWRQWMKSHVKSAMILCLLAFALLGPASPSLSGPDLALAADADILDFLPAIIAPKAPIMQKPVVDGALVTLTWTYTHWPPRSSIYNPRYDVEVADTPTGFNSSNVIPVSGVATPQPLPMQYHLSGTYYYRVRAVYYLDQSSRIARYSRYSNVVSATVIVSPTVVKTTVYASVDNKVVYSDLDASKGNKVYATTDLAVGIDWHYNGFLGMQDFEASRTLLRFNIQSLISGKTINRALLRLYPYIVPQDRSTTYALWALAQDWSGATVTSNNLGDPQVYTYLGEKAITPPTTTTAAVEVDITDIVKFWANGTWINYGLYLYDKTVFVPSGTNALRTTAFESIDYYPSGNSNRRPQLYLEYQ